MPEWLKKNIITSAMSAATAILLLEFVVPGIFDFVFDLVLLGIIYMVGKISASK